jgi:hypothetical protein
LIRAPAVRSDWPPEAPGSRDFARLPETAG